MNIYVSLIVSVVGLVTYVFATNAKIVEAGRIMFWTGLLAFLIQTPRLVG